MFPSPLRGGVRGGGATSDGACGTPTRPAQVGRPPSLQGGGKRTATGVISVQTTLQPETKITVAPTTAPFLDIRNIEVVYDDVILVLRGLSMEVPKGAIVALLGANGA